MPYQSSNVYYISFKVEYCKSYSIYCKTCRLKFKEKDIQIIYSSYTTDYFHLHCFTPIVKQYIRKQDLRITLTGKDLKVFEDWLESWNKNYFCLDYKPKSGETFVQSLFPNINKNIRSLLEIFKFLNLKDILTSVIYVNKEFYYVVWRKEFWQFLIFRDYGMRKICEDPRDFYIFYCGRLCGDCFKASLGELFS